MTATNEADDGRGTARRVLIPLATGLALRNVMRTDLPHALAARGLRPVYAVPEPVRAELAGDVSTHAADVDVLPPQPTRKWDVILRDLAMDVVMRNHDIATMKIKRRFAETKRERTPLKVRISPFLGRSKLMFDLLNALRERLFDAPEMDTLVRRWNPDVVFSNNVFDPIESAVLRRSRSLGVPTVGMVHSWDNPTNKGMLPATCNLLLVWSDVMRREMTTYFGLPEPTVVPVGSPQFDIYSQPLRTTRADLIAGYGLPPDCRIVMYGTSASGHSPHEPVYAARALTAIERMNAEGLGPVALVVRLHPRDHLERYAELEVRDWARLEVAGRANTGSADRWNPTDDDHQHFAALMRYADAVGNQFSTIALDAACNDRPTFHVRFDPEPVDDFLASVERMFSYTHTQRLLAVGASHVATTSDEIEDVIRRALGQPDELRERRRALAEQEGYDGRGLSAERIAAILSAVAAGSWSGLPTDDSLRLARDARIQSEASRASAVC